MKKLLIAFIYILLTVVYAFSGEHNSTFYDQTITSMLIASLLFVISIIIFIAIIIRKPMKEKTKIEIETEIEVLEEKEIINKEEINESFNPPKIVPIKLKRQRNYDPPVQLKHKNEKEKENI